MATNRLDAAKPSEEALRAPAKEAAPAAAASGGIKAWVPLLANLILMPAVAYAITTFVLIPKIQGGKSEPAEAHASEGGGHGGSSSSGGGGSSHGSAKGGSKAKITAPLSGRI